MNLIFICLIFSSASSEEIEQEFLRNSLISNLKVTVKIRVRLKLSTDLTAVRNLVSSRVSANEKKLGGFT